MQPDSAPIQGADPTRRKYAARELALLRVHLERLAHEMRMKTLGTGAEMQDRSRVLAQRVAWFSEQVSEAEHSSHNELRRIGDDLHVRLQKLAHEVAMSIN